MASAIEKRIQKLEQSNATVAVDLTLPTEEERKWASDIIFGNCLAKAYESVCGKAAENYQPPDPAVLAKAQAIIDRLNAVMTPAQKAAEREGYARDIAGIQARIDRIEQEEAAKLAA